jgi:hypothetical protein
MNDVETREITLDVNQIYPGMPDAIQNVTVENNGEMDGIITYEVKKMVILGETYEITDDITSEDLKNTLEEDFPFSIKIAISGSENNIIATNSRCDVKLSLVWPLDGDDEVDTMWGENAYEYYRDNGEDSIAVHLELVLKVEQKV